MLQVQNISFGYNEKPVLKNINFTIEKGQNIAVIGESGCGKSTLLKLVYGLYDLDEGAITWGDKKVTGPKYNLVPGMPFIKYLAQDFDLMPYTTVAENVGKFLSNGFNALKKLRVEQLLEMVEMTEFANVQAKYLSGGQQQRVALARVLANEPEILLLDEPFSHIDNFRKNALRRNLFAYLKTKGITCIVATHDSTDALSYADETIVLQNGMMVDKANSFSLYNNPINKYVASLFGEVNELKLSQLVPVDGADETVLLYPNQLKVVDNGMLNAVVKQSYFKGGYYLIKAVFDRKVIFFEHDRPLPVNETVTLMIS
ncbi:ABC-type Fe3+/spermidine/putrescine transport system ATPase subunit [Flavobacterium sp. 7E]|uniref:ABC transporter ATP-binding protein n=1 Tax=unclassified Flavobacterium TaxID=196869 RepID=UPI001570C1D7|nr:MULTISPECIES: ABC transporter ATP-binding protein [unclassified Flavobacterium]MBE0391076.1 Fe(3+) ions import ATP-binding protein FbpC 2 [Flavobacterium sp. PL002]NRS89464.1 ABC-type Fe3+/spermidine/putrescine transport system ATPase subunit [Flavobacterium sp. 7E]NRT15198.1 ABC-type Fe3+/spermidine/putrescine transport system ATPase subunit [Flavobacterium sp. 28A]